MRGGLREGIYARNITVSQVVGAALSIDFFYREGKAGRFTPDVRNAQDRNMMVQKAEYALYLRGFKNAPVEDDRVTVCDFDEMDKPSVIENVKDSSFRDVHINGKLMYAPGEPAVTPAGRA